MNPKSRRMLAGFFLTAALTVFFSPLGAMDIFKARMMTEKAPALPAMIDIQIEVTSWTTLEEIRQLLDIMGTSGADAFLAAFSKADKGVARFMFSGGWNVPIHAAIMVPAEKGKKVLLFFNRQNWDPGSFQQLGRNSFMAMELKLNEKGKGNGRFYEDVQIKLNSFAATIEIETYESAPKFFPQVQEVVKKTGDKK